MALEKFPLEDIRQRCNLEDIVAEYVPLKRVGTQLRGLCPFHTEKTPSFYVTPDKGIWKCFGCDAGGDVFSFVQRIESLSFPEAVQLLARRVGVNLQTSPRERRAAGERERLFRANQCASAYFSESLARSKDAQEYLERRGIASSSIEKFRIGYAPDIWEGMRAYLERNKVPTADAVKAGLLVARDPGTGFYDRFRNRIMFPIVDTSDRIVAFGGRIIGEGEPKYLNSPESVVFAKNQTLYCLNFARRFIPREDRAIVVEGYLDAMTAQEAGFENTVATLGTALTANHANVLARYTKNVTLCFDSDSAGMAAAMRSAPVFEQAGMNLTVVSLPKGDDPDSLLRREERSVFANLLAKALPITDYRLRLAVAPFDLQDPRGKTEALKAAVKIAAEVESSVERERLIRLMARLHPNFGTGTTRAEEHIRADIERERAQSTPAQSFRLREDNTKTQKNAKSKPLSRQEKVERILLGMILYKKVDSNKVFEVCPAKEFIGEENRDVALKIEEMMRRGEEPEAARLYMLLESSEAKELLTDLIVATDEIEYDQPPDELFGVLEIEKKNEKLARVRQIAQEVQEGKITRNTPEYEEYIRLIKETSSPFRR